MQIDLGGDYGLAILTQPHTFVGGYGDTAVFTASADGEGLTYQWQYKKVANGAWWDSAMAGSTTPTISVEFTPAREAYLYRCKVTDSTGEVRNTDAAGFLAEQPTWNFTYDSDGLRTGRTDGETTYSYIYNGSKLTQMTVGSNTLTFAYDANGKPMTVTLNGTVYYYTTNLQGDITGILDASGSQIVTYTYDAWGNVTVTSTYNIATLNPLTYRGYVYDYETGLYYVSSRYYDPAWGRFLNADVLMSTGQGLLGNNMFAYCRNNPVHRKDTLGTTDVATPDDDTNLLDDEKTYEGGNMNNGGYSGGNAVNSGSGGWGNGIKSSFYVSLNVQMYDWSWQNSSYNPPMNPVGDALCFISGTLVLCEEGTKPIEQIKTGDCVWAWDEETGAIALKEVVETYINKTNELIHVFVNGEEIVTTPSHPFYSPVKGWTKAVRLRAGDILLLVNGEYVVVERVQHEILEVPVTVYNFQVEEYHTYFVADTGVLVHNSCYNTPRTPDQQALADLANDAKRNAMGGRFISYDDARYLDELAAEYGVPQHHIALLDSGEHWITGWNHTHIYNIHVPFMASKR